MPSSEYQNDKKIKKDAAIALKSKQDNTAPPPTEFNYDERLKPVTFKQKLDNFWYHYKVHVFVGAFLFVIASSYFVSILIPDDADATLTIVSPKSFEGSEDIISENIDKVLLDYNGDKKINIRIQPIQIAVPGVETTATPDIIAANQARLMKTMTDKVSFLYLLDEGTYSEMVKLGCKFKVLDEFDSERIKGDKYYLKESNTSELWNLNAILDDSFLCIFDFSVYEKPSLKSSKGYEYQYNFLSETIEYD